MKHLEILAAVEQKFGSKLKAKSHCHNLASEIFSVTGERISYNTLRRAYGLVKSTITIAPTSLNILAHFLGYRDYAEFRALPQREKTHSQFQQRSEVLKSDFEIGYARNLLIKIEADNVLHLTYLLKYMLGEQKFRQVAKILALPEWTQSTIHHYGISIALANFVGRDFLDRLPAHWLDHYLLKTAYPEAILSFFVPSLERGTHYQEHITCLHHLARTDEQSVFSSSLLALWSYLDGDYPSFQLYLDRCKELSLKLFPVLEAQILSLELLALKQADRDPMLSLPLLKKRWTEHPTPRLFLFELVCILMVCLLDEIGQEISKLAEQSQWQSVCWTNNGVDQIYFIAEAFYALQNEQMERYHQLRPRIQERNWHNSLKPNLVMMYRRLIDLENRVLPAHRLYRLRG